MAHTSEEDESRDEFSGGILTVGAEGERVLLVGERGGFGQVLDAASRGQLSAAEVV